MEASDFQNLPVSSTHTIEITRFVDLTSIDPIHFEKSYCLEHEGVGQKPSQLLNRALKDTNRVAIAKVSISQKEHLCCLRPCNNGIIMATMHFPDEIRSTGELELPQEKGLVSDQEVAMAITLIDQFTGTFEPESLQDEYRVAMERVIEVKLGSVPSQIRPLSHIPRARSAT
jgi:DNA end-binding protein Ku